MNFADLHGYAKKNVLKIYTFINDLGKKEGALAAHLPELLEVKRRAAGRTTINEHLVTLFIESLQVKPRLIVELGVGKGSQHLCPGARRQIMRRQVDQCG